MTNEVKPLEIDEASEERSTVITIGDREYRLILTTKATKAIAKRYGGLENLGEKLMKTENFEMALDEVIYLITLLANQSILIHNLRNKEDKQEILTEEEVELLTSPLDLAQYKNAIMASMLKGTKRNVESEESKKRGGRVSEQALFTRLIYYGTVQLNRREEEVWLMPIGYLMDIWECHKQFIGISKPRKEYFIDDVIPTGI
jgi:hypothetical protein